MNFENNNIQEQHFPTYQISDKEIALEEYRLAAKTLESEERIFLNAANLSLVASATLTSLFAAFSDKLIDNFKSIIPAKFIIIGIFIIVIAFTIINLKYFAERQKIIIFATRKIVVLRRMLGCSYGSMQLVLPNWRIEGADQPLSIRIFPGWFTYVSYPFWILLLMSSYITFLLSIMFIKTSELSYVTPNQDIYIALLITIVCMIILSCIFRKSLLDTHETLRLLLIQNIAKLLRLPLSDNFEYIIYRAKLAMYEANRLSISLDNLSKFLIFIEDKRFGKHCGFDYKAIARALCSLVGKKPRSGGSTIHQQIVRTLFIKDFNKRYRRKFIEILLAPWLNKIFPNNKDLLAIYLCSVRYEKNCFGVISAMKFYWGKIINNPSPAEAFFLIERVSNITSSLLHKKILQTVKVAKENKLLSVSDINELAIIYEQAVKNNKIKKQNLNILIVGLNNICN